MSVVFVSGAPAPYTLRLYDAYAKATGDEFHLLVCADIEPHRRWRLPPPQHFTMHVLPGWRKHVNDVSHIYFNPSVISKLRALQPDVIVLGAFSPTMALAALYAKAKGIPLGIATDGIPSTDPGESSLPHRLMRQMLVPRASFGMGASELSVQLLARWGLDPGLCDIVPIVSAWDAPPIIPAFRERPYDVLFSGGVNEAIKGALFFAEVMVRLKQRGRALTVRVVGEGPQRPEMTERLRAAGIEARFDGALQPAEMAAAYCSAKLLLFPSRSDPRGLVANEAVLCETPVLGSPHAASSPMFVERYGLGLVRPLEVEAWAVAVETMLGDPVRWAHYMDRRDEAIGWFAVDNSVAAMRRAIERGRASRPAPQRPGRQTPVARGG